MSSGTTVHVKRYFYNFEESYRQPGCACSKQCEQKKAEQSFPTGEAGALFFAQCVRNCKTRTQFDQRDRKD